MSTGASYGPGAPITPEAVARHLELPAVTDRIVEATGAAVQWAQRRRCRTVPAELWARPEVRLGATLYAALLVQARSTPTGVAGYDGFGEYSPSTADALARARELVGIDVVIA